MLFKFKQDDKMKNKGFTSVWQFLYNLVMDLMKNNKV